MNSIASILLVDDDEVFCGALSRALQRRGFTVYEAHNQQQAIESAEAFHPQYAVVDLKLGTESGLNVVTELKLRLAPIRMVVLTGYASIATAVEAIKLGAVHYLTKPAEADDVIAALEKTEGDSNIEVPSEPMSVKRMQWEHIQKVLNEHDGNISATARALNMHRRTLQRILQKKPLRK